MKPEINSGILSATRELFIDEAVTNLYGLNEQQKQLIAESYKVESVNEYLDRLEEYVGFEDLQSEE